MRNHVLLLFLLQTLFTTAYADLSDYEINRLLICYKEEIDSKKTGAEKYQTAFSNYPQQTELYKLFIDKDRLKNPEHSEKLQQPHLMFDVKEGGYYESMTKAFAKLPDFIGQKVTLDMIVNLHDLAVAEVKTMQKGFSPGTYSYAINAARAQSKEQAFDELFLSKVLYEYKPVRFLKALSGLMNVEKIADDNRVQSLLSRFGKKFLAEVQDVKADGAVPIKGIAATREQLLEKINPLIEHYYQNIDGISSLDGKLEAIGELLRAFEVGHFLPDGNQRTYAFLLLSKLLIENGIPPALLEDPFMFDGYMTVATMGQQIKQGVKNFLNESTDQQRSFLQTDCQQVDFATDSWITAPSDYQAYFAKRPADRLIEDAKTTFLNKIDEAIKNKKVNEASALNELPPLSLAILINSNELIEQLLKEGASPFGAPSTKYYTTSLVPFALASDLDNLALMKRMIDKMSMDDFKMVKARFIKNAISYDTLKRFESEKESREALSQILEKLLDALTNRLSELPDYEKKSLIDDLKTWAAGDNGERAALVNKSFGDGWNG